MITAADFILARVAGMEQNCTEGHVLGCRVYDQAPEPNPDFNTLGGANSAALGDPDVCTCKQHPLLLDIRSMRAIVGLHSPIITMDYADYLPAAIDHRSVVVAHCSACYGDLGRMPVKTWSCQTIRLIAMRWEHHEDFDPAWRPA